MSKTVNLDRAWTFQRKIYGPGEDVEVPDGLYEALVSGGYLQKPSDESEVSSEVSPRKPGRPKKEV